MKESKIRNNIAILQQVSSSTQDLARREGRPLDKDEQDRVQEMQNEIEKQQKALPNGPVTLSRGSFSGGSGGPFASLGEQLQSVARAGIPGGRVDSRLHEINAAATGLNETTPSEGSFLVQSDFSNDLLTSVFKTDTLPAMCRRIPISSASNSIKINGVDETSRADGSRAGGVLGYWLDEAAEKTKSKPKFRQVELKLKKQAVLIYATDELLEDATALEAFIREAAPAELNFRLSDSIVNGSGAGMPLGVLASGCLVVQPAETGQHSGILAENVIKMYSRHLPGANSNSVWLINRNVLPELYLMTVSIGTGGAPVFQPQGGLSGQPYNTILGIPVMPIEQCASLNTKGDIILADMNSYLLAEKNGIQAAMSIHVKFEFDESVFRFVMRVDGQPSLASAITPFKGSLTQSPFVALATRS